jgi:hypothetical protein
MQEQDCLCDRPMRFSLKNPSIVPAEMINIPLGNLAILKIINYVNAV